ncbi:histidine phosphatase family protein [Rhizobium sp. SSA_523]|uniref:SixA phosphatase family protein n=1 Tax=Rhizobium sp. SSA_523 TaxID=2952477 RepID=UPI0020901AD5|nr:histidine phosphatase family protein [Rhizobium sp. SSA_523]MCO5729980.1 histidine phosphatase family protein [Rhizobium sp. SSA_523]WKC25057.1 histidine phosphatase family protein [Rhizobium sp. SSA_523]
MLVFDPPPFRVFLLRHARAGWAEPGGRDFDRPLDDHGFAEAELVAAKAADRHPAPDLILSSTALRCRQTAEALHRAFGEDVEMEMIDSLYNAPLETYLEVLSGQKQAGSVMIIGHNPTMEELLEALLGRDRTAAVIPSGYPTAGLAVLDHGGAHQALAGAWTVKDFITA